ncbi:hypothetical protein [Streptomyces yaizuensis]|uniref:YbaB/EbfC DNA-binding family protein n=1 Tax=Streptomyces yaizuensis TaxID=2989713 RepID=A0ABQ5NY34_9ACTN|nr:hypothetical protein [Streptomyces sp. YSPA8]GLF95266.1 hypothetical protein SYYSPA8_13235 [Streptomyces sp. YSPA8]
MPTHLLAARGGTSGIVNTARDHLADRSYRPDRQAITITAETEADGTLRVTAQVECSDPDWCFSAGVRSQRQVLTALLESTSEFVKEKATEALNLRKASDHRPAARADHQESIGRALRDLIDALEPYAAERTACSGGRPAAGAGGAHPSRKALNDRPVSGRGGRDRPAELFRPDRHRPPSRLAGHQVIQIGHPAGVRPLKPRGGDREPRRARMRRPQRRPRPLQR